MRNTVLRILLLAVSFLPFSTNAQPRQVWEFGCGIGIGAYQGDLHETQFNYQFFSINPSASAHLRRNLSNNFSARLGLMYTRLSGDDKDFEASAMRQQRGISFKGSCLELSALAEIFPFGLFKQNKGKKSGLSNSRRTIAPFATIGIGGAYSDAVVDWNDATEIPRVPPRLAQMDRESPQKFALTIPFGGGVRFRVSNRFCLGIEGTLRFALTDYLDGVSKAANPKTNDWFYTTQLTGSYAFGKTHTQKKRSRPSRHRVLEDALPAPDQDGDGVADKHDDCPDTPGLPSLQGCPDQDEDGIADKDDNCPKLKGVATYHGCPPVDRDKDGIADAEDLCPDMLGQIRWKGCPDSDSDGLPDNKDGCPGIAGPELLRGCPDTDDDGIADKDDECPTMPGLVEKKGCPEAPPPAIGVPYKALYFGSTLQDWHTTSAVTLDEVVAILNADPALFAQVEGHTDNTGREPANDLLAEKRAKKCRDYLVSKGIDAKRLNYLGFGSGRPAVPNDSLKNKQLNRRVEIHFYKK